MIWNWRIWQKDFQRHLLTLLSALHPVAPVKRQAPVE